MYMERTWFYVDAIITARDDNWYTILVYNLPCGKATWEVGNVRLQCG